MLTLEAVTKIKIELEGAFTPLRCRAQIYDAGERLRFSVFDQDYDVACEMAGLSLRALLDQNLLSDVIQKARRQIQGSRRFRTTGLTITYPPDG